MSASEATRAPLSVTPRQRQIRALIVGSSTTQSPCLTARGDLGSAVSRFVEQPVYLGCDCDLGVGQRRRLAVAHPESVSGGEGAP